MQTGIKQTSGLVGLFVYFGNDESLLGFIHILSRTRTFTQFIILHDKLVYCLMLIPMLMPISLTSDIMKRYAFILHDTLGNFP